MLKIQTFGKKSYLPDLLIVHGLFGSGRNWRAIARNISSDRQVHIVDMRNHGESFWDDDNSYESMANDLEKVILFLGKPVDVLGHSMGGKASMVLAINNSTLVNKLLIADIAPFKYEHDQSINISIMKKLKISKISNRSEADQALEKMLPDSSLRAFFLQSLKISSNGNSWQLNLDALEKNMLKIIGFPKLENQFLGETLFLKGELSDYITNKHLPYINLLFPKNTIKIIKNAGHWLHADATRDFLLSVKEYLSEN
ncbi:alpha/beta fold hydrolase [Amylibacter sp.]|nr:alpha/beta fold hydrolase [Amylibacter sp.]MDC1414179.1 alpha/beta fold hydrolase [Amylibacter sp.]